MHITNLNIRTEPVVPYTVIHFVHTRNEFTGFHPYPELGVVSMP